MKKYQDDENNKKQCILLINNNEKLYFYFILKNWLRFRNKKKVKRLNYNKSKNNNCKYKNKLNKK